jgi:hypothetical protein
MNDVEVSGLRPAHPTTDPIAVIVARSKITIRIGPESTT